MYQAFTCDAPEFGASCFRKYDASPWAVTVVDMSLPDAPLVYANAAFYALTGYDAVDALGRNCRFLQGESTSKQTVLRIREAINARQKIEIEILNYRKDGTSFWNLLRLAPLRVTNHPEYDYVVGFQIDISHLINPTGRKSDLVSLHQERLATIGSMAAGVAHEINNPVNGVMMNVQYVMAKTTDPDLLDALQQSKEELERIGKIVQGLLGFSRRESSRDNRVIALPELIEDTLTIAETQLHSIGVKLINKVPDIILPSVYANADAIKQIMINLIMNAAQAMKHKIERPKISLDAYILGSENQVLIRVTDNGLGVPEELHSKIFMPFFTTKPEGEGTGLGLSLAASMANDFGGYLTLDTDYDAGARFLLYIPIAAHEIVSPVMVDKQCLNSMHQILGDDFDGVISAYMGEIKSDLAQMDHAYLLKQWDLLKRLAHTFKGSSLSVCAKGVAQVCMDIEHLIKTNQTDSSILFDSAFLRLYASTEAATHVLNEFIRQP